MSPVSYTHLFAKHTIFPGRRFRPFLAYGLGAIQVWVRELGGRGIGHVTRLSLGLDTKLSERVALEFDLSYQFNILPSFAIEGAEPRSFDFHSLSLTTGIWYEMCIRDSPEAGKVPHGSWIHDAEGT